MKVSNILFLILIFGSCNNLTENKSGSNSDTVFIYFTDSLPKKSSYSEIYNNFTDSRKVDFDVVRSWKEKSFSVCWYLWIDGEIADSGLFIKVLPDDLEKFKARVMRIENEKIPSLLKVWDKK